MDLTSLSLIELREIARSLNIKNIARFRKSDLAAIIEEKKKAEVPAVPAPPAPKAAKVNETAKDKTPPVKKPSFQASPSPQPLSSKIPMPQAPLPSSSQSLPSSQQPMKPPLSASPSQAASPSQTASPGGRGRRDSGPSMSSRRAEPRTRRR